MSSADDCFEISMSVLLLLQNLPLFVPALFEVDVTTTRNKHHSFCSFFVAHGTFIGSVRVDPHQPVQVQVDSTLSFGASTRCFTLRERPNMQSAMSNNSNTNQDDADVGMRGLLGLPEEDTELNVRLHLFILYHFGKISRKGKTILLIGSSIRVRFKIDMDKTKILNLYSS